MESRLWRQGLGVGGCRRNSVCGRKFLRMLAGSYEKTSLQSVQMVFCSAGIPPLSATSQPWDWPAPRFTLVEVLLTWAENPKQPGGCGRYYRCRARSESESRQFCQITGSCGKQHVRRGDFTTVGGQARNNLAALDVITGKTVDWNPNATDAPAGFKSLVNTLMLLDNTIYAGGFFQSIGGQPRTNLAALDASTGRASQWNPNPDGAVFTLAASSKPFVRGRGISPASAENPTRTWRRSILRPATPRPGRRMPIARKCSRYLGQHGLCRRKFYVDFRPAKKQDRRSGRGDGRSHGVGSVFQRRHQCSGGVRKCDLRGWKFREHRRAVPNQHCRTRSPYGPGHGLEPERECPVFALMLSSNLVYLGGDFSRVSRGSRGIDWLPWMAPPAKPRLGRQMLTESSSA